MDNLQLFTAMPVARMISGGAEVEPEPVLRALRKMMASGMVQPSLTPQGSSTAPNLFDLAGVYRAAVAFRLSRIGLDDESVREASRYMNRLEGEVSSRDVVWEVLDRLNKRNEPVYFHLIIAPDYFQKPANVVFGSFSASSDASTFYKTDAWFTTITVPLRGLVRELGQSDSGAAKLATKLGGD